MADDNKTIDSKQQQTETTKNMGVQAAKMYGGPLGKGVELASKTKLGNAVLNKGAETLNKQNPGLIAGNALRKGNSDLLNKKKQTEEANKAAEGTQKAESTGSGLGGALGSALGAGANNQVDDAQATGEGDFSTAAFGFMKKHWRKIVPVAGIGLLFLILIIAVYLIVASIGGGVGEFFSKIGDALIGFFKEDEQELMNKYYDELEKVKDDRYRQLGICIDENLITATLTVDVDAQNYANSVDEDKPPIDDNPEVTTDSSVDYKKMTKEVGLLANKQIKNIKYGNNKYVVNGSMDCRSKDEGGLDELVTADNLDQLHFPTWWENFLKFLQSDETEEEKYISANSDLVSRHDLTGFAKFFAKKVNEEKNYEYHIYTPAYEEECVTGSNGVRTCSEVCDRTAVPTKYEIPSLSIGDLVTMEESVYYWNLVNSFIPEYYEDYIPAAEGEERDNAIKKIAEDIYLLYKDLGPGRSCTSTYDNTNYNYSCIDPNGNVANNIKVELLQCKDGTRFEPIAGESLVDLETYITGVVYAENGGSSNYEALKAQAVAARTYLLKNNDSKETLPDGSTVLKIRNCTERQVYCDPANGCWSDSKTAGSTVHSGQVTGKAYSKGPLPSDSKVYQAVGDTIGEVVYDTDGKLIASGYKASDQRRWNSMSGSDYLTMLSSSYSNLGQLASECIGTPGGWSNWKQANSPWSSLKIGSKTIGQVGCLMTSVAIQIARSGVYTTLGANFDPGTFMQAHKNNGGFSGNSFNWDVTGVAPNFKYKGKVGANNSSAASTISNYVSQGYYVILNLHHPGEHHVAVDHVEGNKIYMFDPGNYGTEVFSASWGGKLTIDSISLYKVE